MIELDEFAVGFDALIGVEMEFTVCMLQGLVAEKLEIGFRPAGPLTIGPARLLKLQQPHIDPHLQHVSTVNRLHLAGQYLAWLEWPFLQDSVDVVASGHKLRNMRRGAPISKSMELLSQRPQKSRLVTDEL